MSLPNLRASASARALSMCACTKRAFTGADFFERYSYCENNARRSRRTRAASGFAESGPKTA